MSDLGEHLLPADLWAKIADNLAYEDVMQVAAINKLFLKEVIPRIGTLNIFTHKPLLSTAQARRFANGSVTCVRLGILDRVCGSDDVERMANGIITFLSHLRAKLSQVHYGIFCYKLLVNDEIIFMTWRGRKDLAAEIRPYLREINICPLRESSDRRNEKIATAHHVLVTSVEKAIAQGHLSANLKFYGLAPRDEKPVCKLCAKMRARMNPIVQTCNPQKRDCHHL